MINRSYFDGDPAEDVLVVVLEHRESRRAAKAHVCDLGCGEPIEKGEQHEVFTTCIDGDWLRLRFHARPCCEDWLYR